MSIPETTQRSGLLFAGLCALNGAFVPAVAKFTTDRADPLFVAAATTFFAGNFDDGSREVGLAGLTAQVESGIRVKDVGESETKDERIWRVIWYAGLALFSEKALACGSGIIPA